MRIVPRIVAGAIGALIIWLAVSLALNPDIVRPSATEPDNPAARAEIDRTWYGELARYSASGLLALFGLTIALAPWRSRRGE